MRAPEEHPVNSLKLGRYAAAGVMALALSLAGVMGGYQLLGAAFGTEDPEDGVTASGPVEAAPCPAALAARNPCDDGWAVPARLTGAPPCAAPHARDMSAVPARGGAEPSLLEERER